MHPHVVGLPPEKNRMLKTELEADFAKRGRG
jgi:hypothetical protein